MPVNSFFSVFFYAFTVKIAISKIILCISIILLCGLGKPKYCCFCIFFYTLSVEVINPQVVLCSDITLFCRFLAPMKCFFHIF